MPKNASKAKKKNDEVVRLVEKFSKAHEYVEENYFDTWDNSWKIYNGQRVKKGYDGMSDNFVPETFTIVESLVANIAGGTPKFEFLPTNPDQENDTAIINSLLDFYWDQNKMSLKTIHWIRDMIIFGNGILMTTWDGDKDLPTISNVPLKDFFLDPASTSIETASYYGYRRLTTKKALQDATILNPNYDPEDPKSKEFIPLYKGLDDIQELSDKWEDLDKDDKEKFVGSTVKDAHKNQVEIIYIICDDKLYEIANRSVIIREEPTPFQREESTEEKIGTDEQGLPTIEEVVIPAIKPFSPFVMLRNYADASLPYAKGDVEVILPTQELVNDISNQEQDNITYVLDNMWQIDPQFADMAPEIESGAGNVFPIPKGALSPIEKPQVSRDADAMIFKNLDYMRRATAADEVVQGASQQQGRITATEVQAQLNQANQRFSTKLNMLESEGYAQLGANLFKMIQIFVSQPMAVRVLGPQGVEWREFDPGDHQGQYDPKVRLEATNKAMQLEEGQKLQAMYQVFLEDPTINQTELKSMLLKKAFGLKEQEVQKLLAVDPAQAQEQAASQGELSQLADPQIPTELVEEGLL